MPLCLPLLLIQACVSHSFSQNRLVKDMGRRALWKWVHIYGKITTGESWDSVVDEETYYEAEPHYGWADVVGDSSQLLSIKPRERPPGGFPALDFGSLSPSVDEPPDEFSPISCGSKNFNLDVILGEAVAVDEASVYSSDVVYAAFELCLCSLVRGNIWAVWHLVFRHRVFPSNGDKIPEKWMFSIFG
ncbi:hypothetical protein ACFX1X_012929 [Malus domestica]